MRFDIASETGYGNYQSVTRLTENRRVTVRTSDSLHIDRLTPATWGESPGT
jgi:hypothetical protein